MAIRIPIKSRNERGYIFLAVMLVMTLMLIALTVEVPRIAQQIKRAKEEEMIHRAQDYVGAIGKYYRKFNTYPVSMDQLERANNIRFLRKRYKDPMTGKDDWVLLHPGDVKLQQGAGIAGASNPGQPAGASPSPSPTPDQSGLSPGQGAGANNTTQFANNTAQLQGSAGSSGPLGGGIGGGAGSGFGGNGNQVFGGGPIVGISSSSKDASIKLLNGKDHYKDWQFVYSPLAAAPVPNGGNPPNLSNQPPNQLNQPAQPAPTQPPAPPPGPTNQ